MSQIIAQLMKVALPDGRNIDVHGVSGPEHFKDFLDNIQSLIKPQPEVKQQKLFLFFASRSPVDQGARERKTYALYQNGDHMAFYILEQKAKGIVVSHCAPGNERAITPEIKPLIDALKPLVIHDVGHQKGIYFNQDQDLLRPESGESVESYIQRFAIESVRQIEQLQKQQQKPPAGLRQTQG